jgi:hypothetical protein
VKYICSQESIVRNQNEALMCFKTTPVMCDWFQHDNVQCKLPDTPQEAYALANQALAKEKHIPLHSSPDVASIIELRQGQRNESAEQHSCAGSCRECISRKGEQQRVRHLGIQSQTVANALQSHALHTCHHAWKWPLTKEKL